MTTPLRARTRHRTVADQRLSDLTVATGIVGLVATVGFGWLAAVTYAGASTPGTADPVQRTIDVSRTQSGSNPSTTNGGSTRPKTNSINGSSSGGSSNGTSRGSGHAHVSTGSS